MKANEAISRDMIEAAEAPIDIVCPLGKGSLHKNLELQCSIRSVQQYATGWRNIYVIGEHPGFEGSYIHIPYPDCGKGKQDNIRRKIQQACSMPGISEDFLFMNDDHFLNAPVDIRAIPNYYAYELHEVYRRRRVGGAYKKAILRTFDILTVMRLSIRHYDIHVPMILNKTIFPEIMAQGDWSKPEGYLIKSLYANVAKLKLYAPKGKLGDHPWPELNINRLYKSVEELEELTARYPIFSVSTGGMDDVFAAFLRSKYLTNETVSYGSAAGK